MDAEFLRTTVGDRLAKAVAAAAESGADDKVEYIADWLLNQVSVEEAGVASPAASAKDALIECCELQLQTSAGCISQPTFISSSTTARLASLPSRSSSILACATGTACSSCTSSDSLRPCSCRRFSAAARAPGQVLK